jgi:hypothetical protein
MQLSSHAAISPAESGQSLDFSDPNTDSDAEHADDSGAENNADSGADSTGSSVHSPAAVSHVARVQT